MKGCFRRSNPLEIAAKSIMETGHAQRAQIKGDLDIQRMINLGDGAVAGKAILSEVADVRGESPADR